MRGNVTGVTTDSAGNRYICGFFSGTVDFNPGQGVDVRTALGSTNAFITKYSSNGVYAWTSTFGGNGNDAANGLTLSGSTLYVTGGFSSDNAVLNGAGPVSSFGLSSVFVLALNSSDGTAFTGFGTNGVVRMGGSGFDVGYAVTASASSVYITGSFNSAKLGFNGSFLTNRGLDNTLAADFTTGTGVPGFGTGGLQSFGGTSSDIGYAIALSGSNLFVAGDFTSSNAGIGGVGGVASIGGSDAFVLELSARPRARPCRLSAKRGANVWRR